MEQQQEFQNLMNRPFQVSVACLPSIPLEILELEDQHDKPWCVRVYKVIASTEVEAESLALDIFHSEVPIACIDDFGVCTIPVDLNQYQMRKCV